MNYNCLPIGIRPPGWHTLVKREIRNVSIEMQGRLPLLTQCSALFCLTPPTPVFIFFSVDVGALLCAEDVSC